MTTKPILERHHFTSADGVAHWLHDRNFEAGLKRTETQGWTYHGFVPVPRATIPEQVRDRYGNA